MSVALESLAAAIERALAQEPNPRRQMLLDLFAQTDERQPLARCVLAHALADVADDLAQERHWDEQALVWAGQASAEEAATLGLPGGLAALWPSLHLNAGDAARRAGDIDAARAHVVAGRAAMAALPDEGYARWVRSGLERLAAQLGPAAADPED